MALERSTLESHKQYPDQERYDKAYWEALTPYIYGDVLDLGCGAGIFMEEYAKKEEVDSVLGIDKFAGYQPSNEKITFIQAPVLEGIDVTFKKFNTIVATEFIEHISRAEFDLLIPKIKKLLKPNGIFVGSTPNKVSPTTNQFHLYEYTLVELRDILKMHFGKGAAWANQYYCTMWKVGIKSKIGARER